MVSESWDHEPAEDELDRRIQSQQPPPPSADLLERCLATIPANALQEAAPQDAARPKRSLLRSRARIALGTIGLAAAVMVACFVLFPGTNGSKNVLADVIRAFEEAPAFHFKRIGLDAAESEPSGTQEVWVVRGVGRRMEVREGSKLVAVVVDNMRWQLQWDVERDHVIAWPSKLADPSARSDDDAVIISRESFVKWGEKFKAEVVPEKDRLDGKEVERIALCWPGEIEMGTNTVWFDPHTRRPLKERYEYDDGRVNEVVIEYPAPDAVPKEQFTFEVPRSALLEVNDPQLGRQLYSEGQKHANLRNWTSASP
jgi:hypothetical protein